MRERSIGSEEFLNCGCLQLWWGLGEQLDNSLNFADYVEYSVSLGQFLTRSSVDMFIPGSSMAPLYFSVVVMYEEYDHLGPSLLSNYEQQSRG